MKNKILILALLGAFSANYIHSDEIEEVVVPKKKKSEYKAKLIDSLKSETNIFINSRYRNENEN